MTNLGKSYAQALIGEEESRTEDLNQILQRILAKLDQQEKTNKVLLERIRKLEIGIAKLQITKQIK